MTKWKGEAASYAPHLAQLMAMVARPWNASLAALVFASGLAAGPAAAADYYWDADGSGLGLGGTGTWNTGAPPLWNSTGNATAGPFFTWNNATGDNAIFDGTAGTVTLGAPITAGSLTFNVHGYTIAGTAANPLTLGGSTPTITANGNAIISAVIVGTAGLTKAGAGTLTLSGNNTFSGNVNVNAGILSLTGTNSFTGAINVNAGTLFAGSDAALGNASNVVNLANGAALSTGTTGGSLDGRTVNLIGGQASLNGAGAGFAHYTGAGGLTVAAVGSTGPITLSDNTNDFTGAVNFVVNNAAAAAFTSIRNSGEASALGAGNTIGLQANSGVSTLNYTGSGDTSNRNWQITNGSGAPTAHIQNLGTGTLTLTGDMSVTGGPSLALSATNADLQVLGVLSSSTANTFRFIGSSRGAITLGNANSFTGTASIESGVVKVGTLANSGVDSSLGAGTNISLTGGTLSYTGTGAGSNRALSISGISTIRNDGSGALSLSGNVSLSGHLRLGGSYTGADNTISGVISGNGNLVSSGDATWVLTGANTRTGTLTVNGGTLRAGSASAFGTTTGIAITGGTLDLNGFNMSTASLTGTGGTLALGSANFTLNLGTGANNTYSGSITGTNGSFTKVGAGTLTLTGASTYTGATTIGGGTLALNFAATAASGPTSNLISGASALVMSGGTLIVTGAGGETNSQTFNGLTITGGNNTIRANGTAANLTVNLGAITRDGGLANFILPGAGAITTSNTDGALGGWATVNGTDYAKVVGGNIVAFTSTDYVNQDNASLWQANQILSDAGGAANTPFFTPVGSPVGNVQIGGLQYTAAANSTVAVAAGATLGVDGTIIVAPSVGATNQTITGGMMTGTLGGGVLGVQQNGGGTFTIASTIVDNTGVVGFSKAGTGKVALSGSSTYTGATTVSQGTLSINSVANAGQPSAIGAASTDPSNLVIQGATLEYTGGNGSTDRGLTLARSGAITASTISVTNAAANLTVSGEVVSPDGASFIKDGAGTLTLSNAGNSYTGVTTVSGGTLAVTMLANGDSPSSIGAAGNASSNLVLRNGGKLSYIGGTASSNRGFTLGTGGGGIDVIGGTTLTMSGTAAGAGSLTKTGDGTLVLSGTNPYTGGTTVSAGILRAGSTQAFGTGLMTANTGAALDLAGSANTVGGLSGAGSVLLGGATLTTNANGSFSGTIGGTGGVTVAAGTQTFSGCGNAYSGVTTLTGNSTLNVGCLANGLQPSDIGASSNASSSLVFNNGALNYTGGTVTTDRGFTLQGGTGAIGVANAATTLTFTGEATGAGVLRKDGPGTLILSGTNDYTGGTLITGGILQAGSTSAFGTGGMTVNAGTRLDLANLGNTVAGLAGTGDVTLGSATLTISDGANLTFSGAISGSGGLVKNGTRMQVLSGTASSYTGPTLVNGGILAVASLANGNSNSSIGASSNAATNLVLNGGTLQYNGAGGSTDRQFTLGANGGALDASGTGAVDFTSTAPIALPDTGNRTLTLQGSNTADNTLSAQIDNPSTGTTALTKIGTGTWVLANAESTYTGATTISGGVLAVDKLADGGQASSIGRSAKDATNLVIGSGSTLRYTGAGDTTDRLFTLETGITLIESSGTGAIVFSNTGSAAYTGSGTRTLALGGTNTGLNTMGGTIIDGPGGATTLAKNDSGTWVLTGNNSYTGNTVVNDGNLIIGNGGTTGNAGTGNVIVNAASSTLSFNRSDTFNFSGTLSGPGSIAQLGTGTTVLTAATNSIGGARVEAGTLQVDGDLTTSTFAMNAGTLTVNGTVGAVGGAPTAMTGNAGASTITVNGTLRANGDLGGGSDVVAVSGTLDTGAARLGLGSGNDTLVLYDGAVFSGAGVDAGTGGESGAGDTLQVATTAGRTLDGANVTQFETLLKQGPGTLTLTGDHSYSAGTTIAAGTLQIGNGGSSGTLAGPITNDATLAFNRADALTVAGPISGSGGVNQIGAGVTTLTGTNSYAGPTNVQAGTLLVNGIQSAATGLTTVANGATLGGTGILGGDVTIADGATLSPGALGPVAGTLTINGNLTLGSGSTLAYNFGQAGVEGGPHNDLIKVGGDVRLDGTITIAQTPGGSFGPGVYRIVGYGGTLDDQGLTVASPDYLVQTAVANQVNLVNTTGLTLNFWDGDAGPKSDKAVNGGDGTWRAGGDNWTDSDGQVNAGYASGTFAVFQGAAGTVTVEAGGVSAAGMQFAADGYAVQDGPITLVPDGATGQSIIRVGDGTTDGASFVATIASALAGNTQLVKTDLGALVLAGTNSYTGGTAINDGMLQVERDANLGDATGALTFDGGTLRNTASFASARGVTLLDEGGTFETAADLTLNGVMGGTGALTKSGTGTLVLAGANAYQGGTFLDEGTLSVASDANLGDATGGPSFNGGTLRSTATFSSARSVTLNAGGGTFEALADLTLTGAIGGVGRLTKSGSGTLTLTSDAGYTGGTTISAGTLQLGNGGASGSIVGNVVNNGTLAFNRSDSYTFAGLISGSGDVTQDGSGTTILTAANRYGGTTAVTGGALLIQGDQSQATGETRVNVGTLGGVGTIGGDVTVADAGALNPGGITNAPGTLTINGDLTLSDASGLNYNFGQANVVGGAFNDLTVVGGDLVLDGVLNVTQSAGGSFRPGIYRINSYAGSLDDRGVMLGSMPAGTYTVQTAIAQQVNLVNTTGVTLNFWDGPGGAPGDTRIQGGDGAWRLTDNTYWTDDTGFLNGVYGNGAFAVFAGLAGTVSVDNANGQVTAAGFQFATDGYVIAGGPLTLAGSAAIVRVGDGTLAGTGMTATVEAALTGSAALVKADLGTLVLTGTNSYTGGTVIEEGTLQVSADRNLGAAAGALAFDGGTLHTIASFTSNRPVNLASTGTFRTDDGTALTLSGAFAGPGGFTKAGDGVLEMAGASAYGGATTVAAGTLRAGAANALSGSSAHAVLGGATLDLAGFSQTVGALANAGTVLLGGAPGATLKVAGDYAGSGGTITFNTVLGGDHSATGRLVVAGDTSGTTKVRVSNVGGTGAPTTDGIKLIDVGGASLGSFKLLGDYMLQGQPAVVAGAYGYTLQKNGVSSPTDGDWYLRSALVNPINPNPADPELPTTPPQPLYQPGVPLYESYAQALLVLNGLPTLQQRVGTRYWVDGARANANPTLPGASGSQLFWGRIEGSHQRSEPSRSLTGASQDSDQLRLQAGLDGLLLDDVAGRLIGGLTLHYGTATADIGSLYGTGAIGTQSYGFGGTLTWYGQSGFYVDGQAQATWFDSDLSSHTAGRALAEGNNGFGYVLGAEVGQRISLGGPWSLTPQAQLVYSNVDFDGFTDPFGARVTLGAGDSLQGRLGLAMDYENIWQDAAGRVGRAKVYGIANLAYEFLDGTDVDVAGVSFAHASDRLWGGIGAGGSYSWGDDKYALYGEVSVNTSLANFGDSYDYRGTAGFRMQW